MSRSILINPEDKTTDVEFRKAWNSKLVNIDKYISWLSSKGFLTKGEKQRKDYFIDNITDGIMMVIFQQLFVLKVFLRTIWTSRYRTENTLKYSGEYQLELIIDDLSVKS